jgi:hypothetical protein
MRAVLHPKLSAGRIREGRYGSDDSYGPYGAFEVTGPNGAPLRIMASGADEPETDGFEHVSVSLPNRCPNWPEMCFVKSLFWEPEETVVQFHPPESTYISNHPYVLHMWRDTRDGHRMPPAIMVGVKEAGDLTDKPEEVARLRREHGLR